MPSSMQNIGKNQLKEIIEWSRIKEKVYIAGVENALKLRREEYDVIICTGLSAT